MFKFSTAILFLTATLLLSSCTTRLMWMDKIYNESVSHFFISNDGSKLVVTGEEYHYIFDTDKTLSSLLLSDNRRNITPAFYYFKVNSDNVITGDYVLSYTLSNSSTDNINWLKEHDFTYSSKDENDRSVYTLNGSLKGTRYTAIDISHSKYDFAKPYALKISEEASSLENTGKVMATPITIAADGVLVIGLTSLALVSHIALSITGNCNNPDFC